MSFFSPSQQSSETFKAQTITLGEISLNQVFQDSSMGGLMPIIQNTLWQCGKQAVQFSLHNGAFGTLSLPNNVLIPLKQTAATSGVRYTASDHSNTELWVNRNTANLKIKGETYDNCILQGSYIPFPLKAFGQDSDWNLIINPKINTMIFTQYDQPIFMTYQQTDSSFNTHTYVGKTATNSWTISIDEKMCTDSKNDTHYPYTVELTQDAGTRHIGCGGDPIR